MVSIYHVSEMLARSLVGCLALIEQSSQVRTEFAADSLLEESGFEPSVPLSRKFLPGCCRREIPERLAGVPY